MKIIARPHLLTLLRLSLHRRQCQLVNVKPIVKRDIVLRKLSGIHKLGP